MTTTIEVPEALTIDGISPQGPSRWWFRFGIVAISWTLLAVGAGMFFLYEKENQFDPLGSVSGSEYTIQTVLNTVPGVPGPAIEVPTSGPANVSLRVTGVKCNNSDKPVSIRGSWWWRSQVPSAAPIKQAANSPAGSFRPPGCIGRSTEQPYINLLPDEVINAMQKHARQGYPEQTWILVGEETPFRESDGREGVTHQWQTINFTAVVRATDD